MKILHLTDPHIVPPGETLFGLDPSARLAKCVDSINRHHADADLAVITGDLTDHGTEAEYRQLRQILEPLAVPARLLLGNHDDRRAFRHSFPDHPVDDDGFVQSAVEIADHLLLFLDTEDGTGSGRLCERRMAFLTETLASSGARSGTLFLHHPALSVGVRHFRSMELDDADTLLDTLRRDGRVRHLFCGHVHLPATVTSGGLTQSASRGIGHHMVLDLDGFDARFVAAPPTYDVIRSDDASTSVHRMDFFEDLALLGVSRGLPDIQDAIDRAA